MARPLWFDWRRVVVYTHRWLGIAGCLLFIVWFASGIVMMYARMPELTIDERLTRLPPLASSSIAVPPSTAVNRAGVSPRTIRLGMLLSRPVYRLEGGGAAVAVFADTGEPIGPLDAAQARAVVRQFSLGQGGTPQQDALLTTPDQWTLSVPRILFPLHRVPLTDADGTVLYVSAPTGEVVMKTTARARRWAYAGAVFHWLYFTPLRRQASLWSAIVIWLSLAGCLMCVTGLVWGVWRYSPVRRYRLKYDLSRTPYAGTMRWHHYAGLVFGLATFTWIFSGLLSMDPWDWHPSTAPTIRQREAATGGAVQPDRVDASQLRGAASRLADRGSVKEVELVQFRGAPYLLASFAPDVAGTTPLVSVLAPERGAFSRFDDDAMTAAARAAMPQAGVQDAAWLDEYDAYYYDRTGALALPVLRVRFDDPQGTWLYLDPRRGAIVRKEERLTRVNRWLYHGFHSLDFPILYYRRPLWDVVVIVLSLGGLASTLTALAPAWRRLRRQVRSRRSRTIAVPGSPGG